MAAVLTVLPISVTPGAQQLESEFDLIGNRYRLKQPSSLAVSSGGDRLAVADLGTNLIVVVDLQGRLLWVAGEQVRLEQPGALCFDGDDAILFVPREQQLVLKVHRDNPSQVDTVKNFLGEIDDGLRFDQVLRDRDGSYIVLDQRDGTVHKFDDEWAYQGSIIERGSGRNRLLSPSGIAVTVSGNLAVTDRRNYPLQVFDGDGRFLFYGGWNIPAQSRGWEAVAVAVDSREFIWTADESSAQFRIFDPTGTEIAAVSFSISAATPVAMAGTIDNRVVVLDQTGTLSFYTLE